MSNKFFNQVAVVTGGSTGIGFAIAKALLAEGAKRVYITGRSTKSLEAAAATLGDAAIALVSDVSSLSDLEKLKTEIEKRGDQLDIKKANKRRCCKERGIVKASYKVKITKKAVGAAGASNFNVAFSIIKINNFLLYYLLYGYQEIRTTGFKPFALA